MRAIIPFGLIREKINKLALINFENNPDKIYKSMEIQGFEDSGYRILLGRNDEKVDIYDDYSLDFSLEDDLSVVGDGANEHVQRDLTNTIFKKEDNALHIYFSFDDIYGRKIHVNIKEAKINKEDNGNTLLAPVGLGSRRPKFFPLYILYGFNFVRLKKTIFDIKIDGKDIVLDSFPVFFPMEGYRRSFVRYSFDSKIINFIHSDIFPFYVKLDDNLTYIDDEFKYVFEKEGDILSLKEIVYLGDSFISIGFYPYMGINISSQKGELLISGKKNMGHISGTYNLLNDGKKFDLDISMDTWKSDSKSFIFNMITKKDSLFATWPGGYKYSLSIDLDSLSYQSKWTNNQSSDNR